MVYYYPLSVFLTYVVNNYFQFSFNLKAMFYLATITQTTVIELLNFLVFLTISSFSFYGLLTLLCGEGCLHVETITECIKKTVSVMRSMVRLILCGKSIVNFQGLVSSVKLVQKFVGWSRFD